MPSAKTPSPEDQAEIELRELVAEYYRLAVSAIKRRDGFRWELAQRFENGKPLGWFIEHKCIWPNDTSNDNDGPYSTRAAAVQGMIDHLRTMIVRVRSWRDA